MNLWLAMQQLVVESADWKGKSGDEIVNGNGDGNGSEGESEDEENGRKNNDN